MHDPHLQAIGQLGCAEMLLRILTDYEASFKVLAVIELLLRERTFKDAVLHDGTSALSALHTDDITLQLPLLRALGASRRRRTSRSRCGSSAASTCWSTPRHADVRAARRRRHLRRPRHPRARRRGRTADTQNAVYKLGRLLLATEPAAAPAPAPAPAAAAGTADEGVPTGATTDAAHGEWPGRPPPISSARPFLSSPVPIAASAPSAAPSAAPAAPSAAPTTPAAGGEDLAARLPRAALRILH